MRMEDPTRVAVRERARQTRDIAAATTTREDWLDWAAAAAVATTRKAGHHGAAAKSATAAKSAATGEAAGVCGSRGKARHGDGCGSGEAEDEFA
jgi:hypothetical protein